MFKPVYFLILLLCVSTVEATSFKTLQQTEEVAELTGLKITLNKQLKGKIIIEPCDTCKSIILSITPETKAFRNNKEVALIQAKQQLGKSAIVYYTISTKIVTQIKWFN